MERSASACRWRLAIAVLAGAWLSACTEEPAEGWALLSNPIPIDADLRCDIAFASVPGLEQPYLDAEWDSELVDNQADFCRLWDEVVFPPGIPCDTSAVDFESEVVLVGSVGWLNTGGYVLSVTCVQEGTSPGSLEVRLLLSAPGPGCLVTQALTHPLAIVKVSRPVESATFRNDRVVGEPCP